MKHRKQVLYIAGPMTGYPEFNYPTFNHTEIRLQAAGYATLNPAREEGREHCQNWTDFMRAGLHDVADCDGIALLDGWRDSRGACIEARVAQDIGIPVHPVTYWMQKAQVPAHA